jgi:branched-chain amino acid transport system permease protein
MAGALAGAAGLLLGNQYFVEPTSGLNFMLKAYIATVIGGWGNLWGAAAAALLIAVFELFVGSAVSTSVAEAALFVFLLAMLLIRPQGLFGEAAGERA